MIFTLVSAWKDLAKSSVHFKQTESNVRKVLVSFTSTFILILILAGLLKIQNRRSTKCQSGQNYVDIYHISMNK